MRSDASRHRGYAPPGQTPLVKIPARRRSLSMIAAVTNQGKVRFMIYHAALSPPRLIEFMRRLVKDARRKVFLILDNLNVHKAKLVNAWLKEHADQIRVFFLPPYSPELNPSEYFNGDLKGEIQRGIPPRCHRAEANRARLLAAHPEISAPRAGLLQEQEHPICCLSSLQLRRVKSSPSPKPLTVAGMP